MAFKMKGNPLQRNFFQRGVLGRVLGMGKKDKRPRTATSTAGGGFVGAVGQAPTPTTTGSFVSALGMKSPVEQKKGKGKRTVSYPSAQIEMENRSGTRGMIRTQRTEVVKTKGGGGKKGKGKKMKLRGSGRKKSTSVRNLVTGGRNRTSGRTGRTRRG